MNKATQGDISTFFTHGFVTQIPFTDRHEARAAFHEALERQIRVTCGGASALVTNVTEGRRNVLAFHGIGGIGKSLLCQELITTLGQTHARSQPVSTSVFDFDSHIPAVDRILLGIRASFTQLRGSWKLFDLLHAAHWTRSHPGLPLEEFVRASRKELGAKLGDQIQETLDSTLTTYGTVGLGWRSLKAAYRVLRARAVKQKGAEACPFVKPYLSLLDQGALDERSFAFLASILAWELAQVQDQAKPDRQPPQAVVVFDTWEKVQALPRRSLENLLMHVVHLMPNVLFVVAGREPLDWAEPDRGAHLHLSGADRWPELSRSDNSNQVSIGEFDLKHRQEVLQVQIDMPTQVQEAILSSPASGIPYYLYLSILQFRRAANHDGDIDPNAFGKPLPEVVYEIMSDSDEDEMCLARVAALLERFDEDLLAAGTSSIPGFKVQDFCKSPLVLTERSNVLPYSLSRVLAESIRASDVHYEQRWTESEWEEATNRLLKKLESRIHASLQECSDHETLDLEENFRLTSNVLVNEGRNVPDWLISAADRLASLKRWETLCAISEPEASSLRAFFTGLRGIALRISATPAEARKLLEGALEEPRLSEEARDLFRLYLGRMFLEEGKASLARGQFKQISSGNSRFEVEATRLAAWCDVALGRFTVGKGALTTLTSSTVDDIICQFELVTNIAHLHLFNGLIEEAVHGFGTALATAKTAGSLPLEARAMSYLATAKCWIPESNALETCKEALDLGETVGDRRDLVNTLAALTITLGRLGDIREAEETLQKSYQLAEAVGSPWRLFFPLVAEVVLALCLQDVDRAQRTAEGLAPARQSNDAFLFWSDIVSHWLSPYGVIHRTADVDWLSPPPSSSGGWRSVAQAVTTIRKVSPTHREVDVSSNRSID